MGNAWAEAKWIVNQIGSGGENSGSGAVSFAPNNILTKAVLKMSGSNVKLIYTWPEDSYIEGILVSSVKGVEARLYTNEADLGDKTKGILLHNSIVKNEYSSGTGFVINGEEYGLELDNYYWIQLFPYNTQNGYNTNIENAVRFKYSLVTIYGCRVNKKDSNPTTRVEYLEGYANELFTPAAMDYTSGTFNYGSWTAENIWFMNVKPCVLGYDGVVQTYLNPNSYTLDVNGNTIAINSSALEGNVMVEIPCVWLKTYTEGDYQYFLVADGQADDDYHAYAHTDANGNIMQYTYMPAYLGCSISSKLRSLSGQTHMVSQTANTEVTYAKANNLDTNNPIWYTEVFADRQLINTLLLLISKTTDSQTAFGQGRCKSNNSSAIASGTMNTKGLFWGDTTQTNGVKVFGMENYWGNIWRRIGGYINDKGTQKIKLTWGMEDGSEVVGYNFDGSGYISIADCTPAGTSGGYVSDSVVNEYGWFPKTASGSASTYEADGLWYNNSQVDYALVGGYWSFAALCGAWCVDLCNAASVSTTSLGAGLSCKPLVS